jgi:hypothetical protein
MPQFKRLAAKFKSFKFGCCEPVHDLMPHRTQLPGHPEGKRSHGKG